VEWPVLYGIIGAVVLILAFLYLRLRKKMKSRADEQQTLVEQHKQTVSMLILDKRMDKITNANMPKSVMAQVPKMYKLKKVPLVKAKMGPQVMDFLCEEDVFDKIPVKKSVNVELAGIFIAGVKGDKPKSTKGKRK